VFDLLLLGPYTLGGTFAGLAAAFALHELAPSEPSALYVGAGLVAFGFIVGLVLEALRDKKRP
jgi:hypothetical protein